MRFRDPNTHLAELADEVVVRCPSCHEAATVRCQLPCWKHTPRLVCARCGFARDGSTSEWTGPSYGIARRRCPTCGRWHDRRFREVAPRRHQATTACPCGTKVVLAISWSPVRFRTPNDPFFGYPLWFQSSVGRDVLWAYNRRHLSLIRNWAGATIRQKSGRSHRSLLASMPTWIKLARNREAIVKTIERLQSARPTSA